jgi:mRNA interferase MazF
MICKRGDILLIHFPFTDLSKSKKRPVLVIKDENSYGDFVCFQITTATHQTALMEIVSDAFQETPLPLRSFVKYDKCFTLNKNILDKKLTSVNDTFLHQITDHFCKTLG